MEKLVKIKAVAVVNARAYWGTEKQAETVIVKLAKVKAETIVNSLADTLPEVEGETLSNTLVQR